VRQGIRLSPRDPGLDRWQRRRFVAAVIAGCVGFVLGIVAAAAVLALVIR